MNNEINYVALGKRIRQSRKQAKLTQEQLAEATALSVSYVGHVERGTRISSIDTLFKISAVLNVSMDYLIADSLSADRILVTNIAGALEAEDRLEPKTISAIIRALADKVDVLQ